MDREFREFDLTKEFELAEYLFNDIYEGTNTINSDDRNRINKKLTSIILNYGRLIGLTHYYYSINQEDNALFLPLDNSKDQ